MDDESLQKRISETIIDSFPLDRLLPLESVYLTFEEEYHKSIDRNIFFKERKYQRLREGYFAMFICISLQDITNNIHYLVFPSNPDNDFYIAYKLDQADDEDRLGAYEFDIKEFTNWSPSFEDFFKESVMPKINIYNIAVPTYKHINYQDLQLIIQYLRENNINKKIWLLGSPTEKDCDYNISRTIIIDGKGILYDKEINLKNWIDENKQIIVFQDTLRFR